MVAYFTEARREEFWGYHKARLKELGYPLKRFDLMRAAVRKVMQELLNPEQAFKKIRGRVPPKPAESRTGSHPLAAIIGHSAEN